MKISSNKRNGMNTITGAVETGTHFYKMTLNTVIDSLNDNDGNLWLIYALQKYGWNALDTDHNFYGSKLIDDIFYLCVTDGHEIEINDEIYDPEYLLEEFDIEAMSQYIQDANDEIIHRYVTPYEMNFKVIDIDQIAIDLLNDDYSFIDIVEGAHDADILNE